MPAEVRVLRLLEIGGYARGGAEESFHRGIVDGRTRRAPGGVICCVKPRSTAVTHGEPGTHTQARGHGRRKVAAGHFHPGRMLCSLS